MIFLSETTSVIRIRPSPPTEGGRLLLSDHPDPREGPDEVGLHLRLHAQLRRRVRDAVEKDRERGLTFLQGLPVLVEMEPALRLVAEGGPDPLHRLDALERLAPNDPVPLLREGVDRFDAIEAKTPRICLQNPDMDEGALLRRPLEDRPEDRDPLRPEGGIGPVELRCRENRPGGQKDGPAAS